MPSKTTSPIAALLKEARSRLGISQYELADRSGVARITIAGLETGKNAGMRTTTAQKLAKALGLPASDFLGAESDASDRSESSTPDSLIRQLSSMPGSRSSRPSANEVAWLRQMLAQWGTNSPPTLASVLLLLLAHRVGQNGKQ